MRINNEQPLGGSHVHTPEHTAAQSLITMFERVPASYRNESTITKEKLFILARSIRELGEERDEFPDTTPLNEGGPWQKRKARYVQETRELLSTIHSEYETPLPFDPTLIDDEHLISVMHTLAEIVHPEE
jgi:hypothetical protein